MNLRIIFRNLLSAKSTFYINLLSLVLSYTLVIVLLSHAIFLTRTDRHIPASEEVAAVAFYPYMLFMPYPAEKLMETNFPSVEAATTIDYLGAKGAQVLKDNDGNLFRINLIEATPGFFDVFGVECLQGSFDDLLETPGSLALTQSEAKKIFGNNPAVGEILFFRDQQVSVRAVIPDVPDNTTTSYGAVLSFCTKDLFSTRQYSYDNWDQYNYHLFARFTNTEQIKKVENGIAAMMRSEGFADEEDDFTDSLILPLRDLYFTRDMRDMLPHGNKNNIILMISAALAVLLVAVLNYINLSTAQSSKRLVKTAIRKVAGASRFTLVRSVMTESSMLSIIAAVISLFLAWIIVRVSNQSDFFGMSTFLTSRPLGICISMGIALITGIISGIYPSLILTSKSPVKTLKPDANSKTGGRLMREILTVSQFTIATILVIFTLLVKRQNNYLKNNDPGFNKEGVIYIETYRNAIRANLETFKQELMTLPGVEACSGVSSRLGELEEHWGGEIRCSKGSINVSFYTLIAERDYPQLMGLKLASGNYAENIENRDIPIVYINGKAFREFGLEPVDIGTASLIRNYGSNDHPDNGRIVGMLDDFNFHSYHQEIQPLVILCSDSFNNLGSLAVRVNMKGREAVNNLLGMMENKWNELETGMPFSYDFLDDHLAAMYADEERFDTLFSIFMVIAIIIASLNILGLSAYISEQRKKEIALRKVNGASVKSILQMLSQSFLIRTLSAFVIAAPLGYFISVRWLQNYAFHTNISLVIFVITVLLTCSVALSTAMSYSYRSATANPANSLRSE